MTINTPVTFSSCQKCMTSTIKVFQQAMIFVSPGDLTSDQQMICLSLRVVQMNPSAVFQRPHLVQEEYVFCESVTIGILSLIIKITLQGSRVNSHVYGYIPNTARKACMIMMSFYIHATSSMKLKSFNFNKCTTLVRDVGYGGGYACTESGGI